MAKYFQDKVCLITGGGSGIGKALCQQLHCAGAIVIIADLNLAAAEALCHELGANSEAVQLDVTNAESVTQVVDDVVSRHSRIDLLFNNAGINILGEFSDLDHDDWRKIMDVNLWGAIYGCQAAYAHMRRQGSGHIVNMSSGLGLTPSPRNSAYSASKHAVVGLSESLRIEAKDLGIHVSTICPGWIKTPMLDAGQVAGHRSTDSDAGLKIGDVAKHIPFGFVGVEEAAVKILRGIQRRKPMIIFPAYVRVFRMLYFLLRPLSDWWNRREIRAFRRLQNQVSGLQWRTSVGDEPQASEAATETTTAA